MIFLLILLLFFSDRCSQSESRLFKNLKICWIVLSYICDILLWEVNRYSSLKTFPCSLSTEKGWKLVEKPSAAAFFPVGTVTNRTHLFSVAILPQMWNSVPKCSSTKSSNADDCRIIHKHPHTHTQSKEEIYIQYIFIKHLHNMFVHVCKYIKYMHIYVCVYVCVYIYIYI